MVSIDNNVKIWIFITLCCLLGWIIYWIPSSFYRFGSFDGTPWDVTIQTYGMMFVVMELSAAVGMLVRFFGILFAIIAFSQFWPDNIWNRNKPFSDAKKWVASALAFESIYFACLLPSGLFMVGVGINFDIGLEGLFFGINYLLMVLFTVPFLAILAVKIYKLKGNETGFTAWNWVAVTFVGYITSLWINIIVKSFSVIEEGFSAIFIGIGCLPLIFAVIGAFFLVKQNFGSALKWGGLALTIVGLEYLLYGITSFLVDKQSFLMLAEIWAIPLLGLGITMLRTKVNKIEKNLEHFS